MAVLHEVNLSENYISSDSIDYSILTVTNISESEDFLPTDTRNTQVLDAPITEKSEDYIASDSINNSILNTPIKENTLDYIPNESFNNIVGGITIKNLSENYISQDSYDTIVYSPPKIISTTPSDKENTYLFYPKFEVTVESETQVKVIFELYDNTPEGEGGKQLIKSWGYITASNIGGNQWYAYYKFDENLDGYLLPGTYNLLVKVENESPENNYAEQWVEFYLSQADIEIIFYNLEYLIEKNELEFTFKIRCLSEIWVSLYNLLVNEYLNKPFTIEEVEYDEDFIQRDKAIILKTSSEWKYLKIKVKHDIKQELQSVSNKFRESKVNIDYKILITDIISNKTYDLTRYFKNISFNQSMELGASQADIEFVIEKGLSPFINSNTPLFYGNKVKVYSYLENTEYLEWQGYITSINTSKDSVKITCFDKLINFNRKLEEDLQYSPQTEVVKEQLKAIDGVRFRASYDSWVESYRPKIWVGDELLKAEEYRVDYYRGEVYIMKNPYLSPTYEDQTFLAENIDNRQTINIDYDINLSSTIEVYHLWKEKVDYSCVEGVEDTNVWIDKNQKLVEGVDYKINYDEDKVILYEQLPPNDDTKKDHKIRVKFRKDIGSVVAEYKYYVPHTNEIDDIIKDLAKKVGFTDTELQDSYQEEVFSRDNFNYQLSHKSIKEINWIKVDNNIYSGEYNLLEKQGLLELDVGFSETIIDSFNTLFKITKSIGVTTELDDDAILDKSVKATLSTGQFVGRDYHYYNVTLDLSYFKEVSFMIKPNKDLDYVKLELIDNNWDTIGFIQSDSLKANEWNECIFNISNLDNLDKINELRIWVYDDCVIKVNYFHTPTHKVEVSYTYNTIESPGLSASEVYYMKQEVDTYKDVLDDICQLLPPSYRLYVDKNEKLIGKDLKMPFYYILPLVYSRRGKESDNIYGKFLIPDYSLNLMASFEHEISIDQLYNGVIVVGKRSYSNDVAMQGTVEDKCSVVSATTNRDYGIKVLIDGDVDSVAYWYVQKRDDANNPFSTDELLIKLTLKQPIYWKEIVLTVGHYQNKVVRSEFYIECETEDGERFYPEDVVPQRKQAQTGSHLKWENKRFKYKKIKYIYVYGSQPFQYYTSESISGGKK